jgi:hypothetical protein
MVTPLSSENEILEAIHQLPLLESIHLDFGQPGARGVSPFPIAHGFSNLKSIVLSRPQARCGGREWQRNLVSDGIHSLLVSSPFLESLGISGVDYPMDFSDLVKELPNQTNFEACLKSLQLRNVTLSPSSTTLQYLYNLQSLDIPNAASDKGIWEGLRFFGTRLKIIKISQVTIELVDYILDYQGLEELNITAHCCSRSPILRPVVDCCNQHSQIIVIPCMRSAFSSIARIIKKT